MPKVRDILAALDARFAFARAEKWDRVGLLIGDRDQEVARVVVAYEITPQVLSDVDQHGGGDCIVTYHPLLFRPLENLDFANHTARLAAGCIKRNIAVVAAHTALDGAPLGRSLGDALAAQLGLGDVQVLGASGREDLVSLCVLVPRAHADQVARAMWEAGGGSVGNYDRASFRVEGQGSFRALENAHPTVGQIGRTEFVAETRLEMIVPASRQPQVLGAARGAHPYEEMAHFVFPLANGGEEFGSCRVGDLAAPMSLDDWARQVEKSLRPPNIRLVRARDSIGRVACVPGSGASFLDACARANVDCLVSGDFKHHDALKAKSLGVSIVDVTHAPTERATVELLCGALQVLEGACEVRRCEIEMNPFEPLDSV